MKPDFLSVTILALCSGYTERRRAASPASVQYGALTIKMCFATEAMVIQVLGVVGEQCVDFNDIYQLCKSMTN